ncbi:MAG: ABC transporter permease, partial [Deinococcus sp.]|nr:ABC transporter permease [Deinococcus sp.]
MTVYIIKRILQGLPTIIGATLVTFLLTYATGANPCLRSERSTARGVELCRQALGLDRPWYIQVGTFYGNLLQGDLGVSLANRQPVSAQIADRIGQSARLALVAFVFAVFTGVIGGVVTALRRNTLVDYFGLVTSLLGVSMPAFLLGLVLQYFIGYKLRWLPISGWKPGPDAWRYMILPAIVLAAGPIALLTRLTRSAMLDVLSQDYVRTARAKGLTGRIVVYKHALRNAMIPVVTVTAASLAVLLEGSFVVEFLFSWPGLGK